LNRKIATEYSKNRYSLQINALTTIEIDCTSLTIHHLFLENLSLKSLHRYPKTTHNSLSNIEISSHSRKVDIFREYIWIIALSLAETPNPSKIYSRNRELTENF
jgi:hypothetical protein